MRVFVTMLSLAAGLSVAVPAVAAGDLLIAPTRVVMNGSRGTELILNNIGSETATYRISLELRRMLPNGEIEEVSVANANDQEKQALSMISYAPRRVVLPPNQPQAIRLGVRAAQGLPDGEYRAHMLFRAIPDAKPVTGGPPRTEGISISLKPIYGITIPIIIRQGNLVASAAITGAKIEAVEGKPSLVVNLTRSGTRSTYGHLRVLKAGVATPLFEARGLAVYAEVPKREIRLALSPENVAKMTGQVTIEYREDSGAGGGLIADYKTVIR